MNKFTKIISHVAILAVNNIDTDQIIPARYLKTTTKAGLGEGLFADWRYFADGSPKTEFVLNRPGSQGAQILAAGDNFGCGSSREHAPWALTAFGFRTVLSTSFADIFRSNALKNGLLPIILNSGDYQQILAELSASPLAVVTIDLAAQQLTMPSGKEFTFPIDGFSKTCLLNGVDELGYLLGFEQQITQYEAVR
jgi:3-isopropylmalate/(R)-2-methylmalate dehydratase small subunit